MDITNLAKTPVPATKPLVIVHKNCLDGLGAALAALPDNPHQIGLVFTGFNRDNGLVFSARGLPDTTLALDLALKFDGGGHQTAASGHMSLASLQRYLTKNALHLKL